MTLQQLLTDLNTDEDLLTRLEASTIQDLEVHFAKFLPLCRPELAKQVKEVEFKPKRSKVQDPKQMSLSQLKEQARAIAKQYGIDVKGL